MDLSLRLDLDLDLALDWEVGVSSVPSSSSAWKRSKDAPLLMLALEPVPSLTTLPTLGLRVAVTLLMLSAVRVLSSVEESRVAAH